MLLKLKKTKTNKEYSYTLELVKSDTIDNYCVTNNINNIDFLKLTFFSISSVSILLVLNICNLLFVVFENS